MADVIRHRGPDDHGYFIDGPVHLGHRRLSIIDLEGGKQPLSNEDGKVTIVYNGEVYNFAALKEDLLEKGHVFKTASDTEVLVHLWEEVGTEMPSHLNGMFAFALWDANQKVLFMARDRMGQKPLYWTHNRDGIVFGSELRSLLTHPTVERRLDPLSLGKYMLFDSVPAPGSVLQNVNKLEPGTWLLYKDGRASTSRYWDITFPGKREKAPTFAEAKDELYQRMRSSVERRMISDVPLGVFLSGGIDSSAVTALMCDLVGPSNVKTFSVGFANSSFDESEHANSVAQHFGTQHFTKRLEASTMMELLPGIVSRLDEPLADNSLIPTYFLSGFAREHVTVALGGDGGDELCLGYPTFKAHKIARWYGLLPRFFRSLIARLVETLPVSTDNISFDYQAKQFVRGMEYDPVARHFIWIGSVPPHAQGGLFTPDFLPSDPGRLLEDVARHAAACTPRDDFDRLSYVYSKLYMCDDILTKVDRASMMHSLEVRAPLLDPEVVDYLTSLPTRYKLHGFKMKRILTETFQGRLPDPILARKKKGFGVPVAEWLKGPLRPWVEELFSTASLKQHGVLSTPGVQRLWTDHLAGVRDNRKPLWSMVVLLLWMQENL